MQQCRVPLVIDETETDDPALIGEMCHMVAESEDGPRGHSPMTREQRDTYQNLILLCRNHHGEIDAQPATFSVERLQQIKTEHEDWVSKSLPGYDQGRQSDDEIYAGYVDEWARRSELDGWSGWTSFLLSHDDPKITVVLDLELEELRTWLLNRVWPGRYPKLEQAFANFRVVLQDFQNVFREHAEKPTLNNDWLVTVKFYHIREWDKERYDQLLDRYLSHVALVQDLVLELTRAANFICDEVRATILRNFRLSQGRVMVKSGPHPPDGHWQTFVVQYSTEEKQNAVPYPGLEKFKEIRFTRDRWFGDPSGRYR